VSPRNSVSQVLSSRRGFRKRGALELCTNGGGARGQGVRRGPVPPGVCAKAARARVRRAGVSVTRPERGARRAEQAERAGRGGAERSAEKPLPASADPGPRPGSMDRSSLLQLIQEQVREVGDWHCRRRVLSAAARQAGRRDQTP
jgi:hypothetical protein